MLKNDEKRSVFRFNDFDLFDVENGRVKVAIDDSRNPYFDMARYLGITLDKETKLTLIAYLEPYNNDMNQMELIAYVEKDGIQEQIHVQLPDIDVKYIFDECQAIIKMANIHI